MLYGLRATSLPLTKDYYYYYYAHIAHVHAHCHFKYFVSHMPCHMQCTAPGMHEHEILEDQSQWYSDGTDWS